jgi:hypothetical protein
MAITAGSVDGPLECIFPTQRLARGSFEATTTNTTCSPQLYCSIFCFQCYDPSSNDPVVAGHGQLQSLAPAAARRFSASSKLMTCQNRNSRVVIRMLGYISLTDLPNGIQVGHFVVLVVEVESCTERVSMWLQRRIASNGLYRVPS